MSVDVKLNRDLLGSDSYIRISFNAKYSDSILAGFFYRNGKQHEAYDYILEVLQETSPAQLLADGLLRYKDFLKASDYVVDELYNLFVQKLSTNQSGMETLNWFFRDFEPSKHITIEEDG
jgi:hypothetical protein